jgi:hypothetical protein
LDGFPGAVRTARTARLDLGQLTGPRSQYRHGKGTDARRQSGQVLQLRLPGHAGLQKLTVDHVHEGLPGVFTYSGLVNGDEASLFTISVEGLDVTGTIHLDSSLYVITGGRGGYALSEIEKTLIPGYPEVQHDPMDTNAAHSKGAPATTSKPTPPPGNVNVLVLHTPAVVSRYGNANTFASSIIAEFKTSLINSGVAANNTVTLAGVRSIHNNLVGLCRVAIRDQMVARQGPFANLNAWRAETEADVILMVVDEAACTPIDPMDLNPRIGGIARVLTPAHPFAITSDTHALGDRTALHELGHTFGGSHEFPGAMVPGAQPDARGHVDEQETWMTIMGGYLTEHCVFPWPGNPATCVRQPRWSNPSVTLHGRATGVENVSNMVRVLNSPQGLPAISTWVPNQPPPSTAPSISVISEKCYGINTVSWGAVTNASRYELYRSTSSWFSNAQLAYIGLSRSSLISVASTTYLRVRACNSGGCGPYSAQVSANYFNGCM